MNNAPGMIAAGIACTLAGCVAYRPASLPKRPDLQTSVAGLDLPGSRLPPLPAAGPRRIDPHAPLDATDAAILAVLNDPALRADRAHNGRAAAQLFAAGLLPDPVLKMTRTHPTGGGQTQPGHNFSLSEALLPLITHSDRVRAARARVRRVDLGLLWKEWQVAQHARWLVAEVLARRRMRATETRVAHILGASRSWLHRLAESHDASGLELSQARAAIGTLTHDTAATERGLNDSEQRLCSLLGVEPGATLRLRPTPAPKVGTVQVARAIQHLPHRRPDLLALAAGFRSSDQKLRAAVAAQFPAIAVSFLQESDVEGVPALGFGLTLRLPFFNGNSGAIRKAEASRTALRADYQARIDKAVGNVARLARDYRILKREVAQLQSQQAAVGAGWKRVRRLGSTGAADRLERLHVAMDWYRARRRDIAAKLALHKTAIALETMLGVPPARLGPPAPASAS